MRFAAALERSAARGAAAAATLAGVATLALAAFGGSVASAQSVSIGGNVDDEMQLLVDPPTGTSFATFPHQAGDHVYTAMLSATVTFTTSNTPVTLSVADPDTEPVAQQGHLVTASGKVLPLPLQVSGTAGKLMSLAAPVAPVLETWTDQVSSASVPLELSQEVDGTSKLAAGPYGEEVMVTLTSAAP
jgi:hypothetical protein